MNIEIPTSSVTVTDTDAADALVAAGWTVIPPDDGGGTPPVPDDPYSEHVRQLSGLALWLMLNDGTLIDAVDSSGQDHHGHYTAGSIPDIDTLAQPSIDQDAVRFAAGQVTVPHHQAFNLGTQPTDGWMVQADYRADATEGYPTILHKGSADGSANSWVLWASRSVVAFKINDEQYAVPGVDLGTFANVAATWDGQTLRLYVNGREVGHHFTNLSAQSVTDTGPLHVGGPGTSMAKVVVARAANLEAIEPIYEAISGQQVVIDPPPPTGGGDIPVTGWPTDSEWSQGGRLVCSDDFDGSSLSPLFGNGMPYQGYGNDPWTKQAESQWNVLGVYSPDQLVLDGSKLRVNIDYRPEGVPGPGGNNPAHYVTGAFSTCPPNFLGTYPPALAQTGFAFQLGQTALIIEWVSSMPQHGPLGWGWFGAWLSSFPTWVTEFDLTEGVGDMPDRPIMCTSHWHCDTDHQQTSQGPWAVQPQPGSEHVYTAVINLDCSFQMFMDGSLVASNPAVDGRAQWMYWMHQSGLSTTRPQDLSPGWTGDHQDFFSFRVWQPASTPQGHGIHGGGLF